MPVKSEREYRTINLTATEEEMVVTGYASTYDDPYDLYRGEGLIYREVVDEHAFDNADLSDVILQYNHEGRVYARTRNDTLKVEPDERGLKITADLSGTEAGRELYSEIKGGYTDRMSFGFTVESETEEREEDENGVVIYTRHITGFRKIYDVSAVSMPANDATTITAEARSVNDLKDGLIQRVDAERRQAIKRKQVMTKAKVYGGTR